MLKVTSKKPSSGASVKGVPTISCMLLTMLSLTAAEINPKSSYFLEPPSYSTARDPDVPKYAHTSGKIDWLDCGMDHRTRFEYRDDDIRRPDAGLDTPLLHRTRCYWGIHDLLDPFRVAIEMQDSRRSHGDYPRDDRDCNEFELIRLQAELYFDDVLAADPRGNARPLSLRYGIQNFEFLDRRLLGNNQWRNTANTFLGLRGAVGQDANDWNLDMLAVQPMEREISQSDKPVDGQWVYGLIGHWRGWKDLCLEPFYLILDQEKKTTAEDRTVHSPGLRAYGRLGDSGFDFDASLIHQFGKNDELDISAWGGTAEIGYRWQHSWQPRISAFWGFASGDRDPADDSDNRFERFYGFGRPWSANDSIVFENIIAPKLRIELAPHERLRVDFGYSWYRLASENDRFSGAKTIDSSGRSGAMIGHEFDIRARWEITEKWQSVLGYAHFQPGSFAKNTVRSDDTDFFYCEFNLVLF